MHLLAIRTNGTWEKVVLLSGLLKVPSKHGYLFTKLHGVTSKKTEILILTAIRT
jgi:hypothetical protein